MHWCDWKSLYALKEECEAVAYFQAMQLSIHLGLREVKIEGDSRKANKVAHIIASEGIIMRESTYLENLVSPGATGLVAEDRKRMENMGELRGRRVDEEEEIGF
ncbi:hypothetical protein PVK06_008005 [Gossypium arboreum]|uniref:RNase H type-1 domain-containing protein n=1 Tax=Gossypium arboreum TaxID=29729 RepID=A0ABR0QIU4_GOSAR|nr:hypothetical protein PVK06_008005 [Gossypium arboreum]